MIQLPDNTVSFTPQLRYKSEDLYIHTPNGYDQFYTGKQADDRFIYRVSSVTDLSAINSSSHKEVYITDPNTGGIFAWKSTGYTVDGGTVFAGDSGFWVRQFTGAVFSNWFGAKGDGVTDCTNALNSALAAGFKNIIFPDGNYSFTKTTATAMASNVEEADRVLSDYSPVIHIKIPANVKISGAGIGKTKFIFNTSTNVKNQFLFSNYGNDGIVLSDFTIDCTSCCDGIMVNPARSIYTSESGAILNIDGKNCTYRAVEILGGSNAFNIKSTGPGYTGAINIILDRVRALNQYSYAIYFGRTLNCSLINSYAAYCGNDQIKLSRINIGLQVRGTRSEYSIGDGLDTFDGIWNSTITDCYFNNNGQFGIELKGTIGTTMPAGSAAGVSKDNVTAYNIIANNEAYENGISGFQVASIKGGVFSNNNATRNGKLFVPPEAVSNNGNGFSFNNCINIKVIGCTGNMNRGHQFAFGGVGFQASNGITIDSCLAVDGIPAIDTDLTSGSFHGFYFANGSNGKISNCSAVNTTNQNNPDTKGRMGYGFFVDDTAGLIYMVDNDASAMVTGTSRISATTRRESLDSMLFGTGSPEGVVSTPVGKVYIQEDGVAKSKLWFKDTGIGNTGWSLFASGLDDITTIPTDSTLPAIVTNKAYLIGLSANRTVTLPDTATCKPGILVGFKRPGGSTNSCRINTFSSTDFIDGQQSYWLVNDYDFLVIRLQATGNWMIMAESSTRKINIVAAGNKTITATDRDEVVIGDLTANRSVTLTASAYGRAVTKRFINKSTFNLTLIPATGVLVNGVSTDVLIDGVSTNIVIVAGANLEVTQSSANVWRTTAFSQSSVTQGDVKSIRPITAATTILATDYTINITSGTFNQPLPATTLSSGQIINIANSGAGIITVTATSIFGQTSIQLQQGSTLTVQYTGVSGTYIIL